MHTSAPRCDTFHTRPSAAAAGTPTFTHPRVSVGAAPVAARMNPHTERAAVLRGSPPTRVSEPPFCAQYSCCAQPRILPKPEFSRVMKREYAASARPATPSAANWRPGV